MRLAELLHRALGDTSISSEADITRVVYDSRDVRSGDLFVAIDGFHTDGHKYVGDAIARGAAAVLVEAGHALESPSAADWPPVIPVVDTRAALADVATVLAGEPSKLLKVIGVTGTDGKTSTTFLIEHVLRAAGRKTGLIGTVDFRVGERSWSNTSRQTTPEAPEIQNLLAEMVTAGVEYAVLETSSHALALHRVRGVDYDLAVFTNFSSEHLDFHKTREAYFEAKAELFRMLARSNKPGRMKVLNADDETFATLRSMTSTPTLSYGIDQPATLLATDIRLTASGIEFRVVMPQDDFEVDLRLTGRFNVYNALAAIASGMALGLTTDEVVTGIATFPGVPGRMERIDCGQAFTVIVDYAHTADSLEKVLRTLRPLTDGKLIAVFGSAGERDTTKRPVMGEVAGRLADFVVITNEDPRLEDPEIILADIAAGLDRTGRRRGHDYLAIVDRREAIRVAFEKARPGDTVVLCGKGHEQSIIIGTKTTPWDDRAVARELLQR